MTWLRNILFAAAVCMVVDAVRAQEPVRKPDVGTGVRDLSPGSEPYSGGTSVSRKPFTTLPGEVRRQPDAIADTLMRRVASGTLAFGHTSAFGYGRQFLRCVLGSSLSGRGVPCFVSWQSPSSRPACLPAPRLMRLAGVSSLVFPYAVPHLP